MATAPAYQHSTQNHSEPRGPLGLAPTPSPLAPAGFWARFVAALIDGLILGVAQAPFQWLLQGAMKATQHQAEGGDPGQAGKAMMMFGLLWLGVVGFLSILSFAYYGLFYRYKGATPGKMLLGMEVIDLRTGQWPDLGATLVRELPGKMLSGLLFMVGYIMAGFRTDKRALHDLMANTQVVNKFRR